MPPPHGELAPACLTAAATSFQSHQQAASGRPVVTAYASRPPPPWVGILTPKERTVINTHLTVATTPEEPDVDTAPSDDLSFRRAQAASAELEKDILRSP